jgi:hypothetical protein
MKNCLALSTLVLVLGCLSVADPPTTPEESQKRMKGADNLKSP